MCIQPPHDIPMSGRPPVGLLEQTGAVGHHIRNEVLECWARDPQAAMAALPRTFTPCAAMDIDEMYRTSAGLLTVMEAVASAAIPCDAYPVVDLEALVRSLVTGQRNDMRHLRPGSWCVAPHAADMPSDVRVDFIFTPTYAVIGLLTLVQESDPHLVHRVPGFRSAMKRGFRFASYGGLRGHGHEGWVGMVDALRILRTGGVIAWADRHPGFSRAFSATLRSLRTRICEDFARGATTGLDGSPVELGALRWFVDPAVHGERALARTRSADELGVRLRRLEPILAVGTVERWRRRLGEMMCETLAAANDPVTLAERLVPLLDMLTDEAREQCGRRLGELALASLEAPWEFEALTRRYDLLRAHLPPRVREAWLDRLLELAPQATFRSLNTLIHISLAGESVERVRAFKELNARKARTIEDLRWLRAEQGDHEDT